jgi:hypothetical protein
MKRKFVGRFAPLTVINRKGPTPGRGLKGDDQTMNANPNPAACAQPSPVKAIYALLFCLLLATGFATIPANEAFAGTWAVESCSLPSGGPAPIEGWQTEPDNGGPYTAASDNCPTGGGFEAADSSQWEQGRDTGAIWAYTAPAGATIAGGSLLVSLTAPQGVAYIATPKDIYDGNVLVNCQFNLGCGPSNTLGGWIENESVPITHTGGTQMWAVAQCVGSAQPNQPGANCAQNDGAYGVNALTRISQADIELNNANTPQGTGFSGPLLDSPTTGTASLNFTASEAAPGPGIYTVTISIDGHAISTTTPNTNGGKCATLGHDANGVPEYTAQEPCPLSEQANIPVNTTSLTDGHHELAVSVSDAAGDTATVYDGTITTDNAPTSKTAPVILAPSQVFVGAGLSTQSGAWSVPTGAGSITYSYQWEDCNTEGNNCTAIASAQSASYTPAPNDVGHTLRVLVNAADNDGLSTTTSAATSVVLSDQGSLGAPNGTGTSSTSITSIPTVTTPGSVSIGAGAANGTFASETAQINFGVKHTISRSFSHSALQVTGRLLNGQGQAIGKASLDILQQIAGSSSSPIIEHATTQANGTFTAHIPAGASRQIDVAYRAFFGDANYAAQARIEEYVNAAVQLNVTPRDTSPEGTILLTGKVQGTIPNQGVIVDLLVHYRGRWEPFRTPRTDSAGEFQVAYQFQGGIGRFPFRAATPAGQSGFPYVGGYSKAVDVTTG